MATPTNLVHLPSFPPHSTLEQQAEFLFHAVQLDIVNDRFFNKQEISSLEHSQRRETSLVAAIQALATCFGAKLKPISGIDSRGEISVLAENIDAPMCREQTGPYGEAFAAVLSCIPTRTGTEARQTVVLATNGWCRINHFVAEMLVHSMAYQLTNGHKLLTEQNA